ncbi:MAG: glycosyl hydrolase, repeat protein [Myxococcaceae bacterium]|nr:glycosyl hydrolase, repeat protein [Myxococcaceae bacterium]
MKHERIFVSTRKGLFSIVRSATGTWAIERVSFVGDAVSLAFHDARDGALYAGLGLGHFGVKMRRSPDLGVTWEDIAAPAFPPQPEGTVDTLPDGKPWPWRVEQVWALEAGENAGELWCGTIGGGLFHSKDRGASWALARGLWDHPKRKEWFGGGAELPGIHSIAVDPRDRSVLTIGVSCGGVWRSTDGGATWTVSSDGMFAEYMPPERRNDPVIQDPHRIVQATSNPERFWAQHHNGVFRSDDGARTWHEVPNVPPSVFGFPVAVDPNDADTAWLVPAVKDETRVPVDAKVVVARTRDAGKTWDVLTRGLPQSNAYDIVYRHALDVDPTGRVLALGSTTGSLWISEDAGDSFTTVSANLPPIYGVRFAAP